MKAQSNIIIIIIICSYDTNLHFHMTIHEQDRQSCRAPTAALTQNINQIHQYSKNIKKKEKRDRKTNKI